MIQQTRSCTHTFHDTLFLKNWDGYVYVHLTFEFLAKLFGPRPSAQVPSCVPDIPLIVGHWTSLILKHCAFLLVPKVPHGDTPTNNSLFWHVVSTPHEP